MHFDDALETVLVETVEIGPREIEGVGGNADASRANSTPGKKG